MDHRKEIIIDTTTTKQFRCRVCLETCSKMYPLEGPIVNCDVDISTMLFFCTSTEILISKDLPSFVCIPCFKTIRIAYNFINQFRENNKKLIEECLDINMKSSEFDSNDNEPGETSDIVDQVNKTSEGIENVDSAEVDNTFLKSEVHMYETSHISQVDDNFKFVYEDISDNLQESNKVEIYNCEIDPLSNTIKPQGTDELVKNTKLTPRVKIRTRYFCPVCPDVCFSYELYFINHMVKHKDVAFYCNHCENGTIYNDSTYIKHFQDVHKHQCPYCYKSCGTKNSLYTHLRLHSNIKYWCNYKGCAKVFSTNFALKKHQTVHSDDVKHVCEECGMEFKTYDTYKYHQKKHAGRKFLCTHCGRTFMQSIHLKHHMWLHTGIKQFKCDLCDKSYTSVTQLKKHKRRHHPNIDIDDTERFLEVQT